MRRLLIAAALILTLSCAEVATERGAAGKGISQQTDVLLKQLTPEQRKHARVHSASYGNGKDILDQGEVRLVVSRDYIVEQTKKNSLEILGEMVCASGATFMAIPESVEVHPTEDGSFLFSEYQVHVTEVFRKRVADSLLASGQFTMVSRPGGSLAVEGHAVRAEVNVFPALELKTRYLFVADVVPATVTFYTRRFDGVFKIVGNRLFPLQTPSRVSEHEDVQTAGLDENGLRQFLRALQCR